LSGLFGVNQLGEVARAARLAGGDVLPKLRKGLAKVGPPAKKAVKESAEKKLPKRGGYAALMSKSLRVRVNSDLSLTGAGVTIVTYASGKGERRDIPAVNRGILRHPVYGHRRRKWVAQKVSSGFWDDAMDETSDAAYEQVRSVLDETTRTLKG
jgi:hypothetical protein